MKKHLTNSPDSSLISVIMPCFNAEPYIEKSVESVLNQTYKFLELIIVDDGSTDGSLAILEKLQTNDPRIQIVKQKNKGPGPARNKALSMSKGKYIAFLDADDYWAADCLEKLEKAISSESRSGYRLAYCGWQNIGLSEKRSRPFIPPDYNKVDLPALFLAGCKWPIHAVLCDKACIERIGGFNEQWSTCMDYDLWLRMSPFLKVVLVSEVLAFYRHHGSGQITGKRALIAENHWKIQKQFISRHPEIAKRVGKKIVKKLIHGELLQRAYICYWERNLSAAHKIFRLVVKTGYGRKTDWKYMLPALFPFRLYTKIVQTFSKD